MVYTVKKLSQLSKVSIRTLHWYDEIGLLKPSFLGLNGYRYYEEKQVFILQQILFFRELGFTLKEIKALLTNRHFDLVTALSVHKQKIQQRINRLKELVKTIEKTALHLKGEQEMKRKDIYQGFEWLDVTKQREYEEYLVKHHGTKAEELIQECQKRTGHWGPREWEEIKSEGNKVYQALAQCIEEGLSPEEESVQWIVHQHCEMNKRFYDVSKDLYKGLASLYKDHPGFRKFFDPFHPQLVEFIGKAMRIYAEKHLS